jgi:hypothetical protein
MASLSKYGWGVNLSIVAPITPTPANGQVGSLSRKKGTAVHLPFTKVVQKSDLYEESSKIEVNRLITFREKRG